jgi:hypothetical protein
MVYILKTASLAYWSMHRRAQTNSFTFLSVWFKFGYDYFSFDFAVCVLTGLQYSLYTLRLYLHFRLTMEYVSKPQNILWPSFNTVTLFNLSSSCRKTFNIARETVIFTFGALGRFLIQLGNILWIALNTNSILWDVETLLGSPGRRKVWALVDPWHYFDKWKLYVPWETVINIVNYCEASVSLNYWSGFQVHMWDPCSLKMHTQPHW